MSDLQFGRCAYSLWGWESADSTAIPISLLGLVAGLVGGSCFCLAQMRQMYWQLPPVK